MKPFLLAVAQLSAVRANKDVNLQHMAAAMHEAASAGAKAILFPELSLTGYVLSDEVYALAEPRTGPSLQKLSALARQSGLLTVYGWPESSEDGPIYDSAALIESDGSLLDVYRKTHLFGREAELFAAGERLSAVDTSLGRIGVAICYDMEFPETARLLALDGARILITLTASADPYAPYQAVYTRARAMENSIYVATANTVGELDGRHFFGESSIVDPAGQVIRIAAGQDEVIMGTVDPTPPDPSSDDLHYLTSRRPELYGGLTH